MENQDHEFCLRCGRKLRNANARELGYGAICFKKLQADGNRQLFETGSNLHSSQQKEQKEKDLH